MLSPQRSEIGHLNRSPSVSPVSHNASVVMARKKSSTSSKSHSERPATPVPPPREVGDRAAPKTGKVSNSLAREEKKKSTRKRKTESFKLYIFKVLKQVHPKMGISGKAMVIMDSLVIDLFERIAREASRLACMVKKSTLSSREIQTAVRLILPGELGKHAVVEGTKAVTKYTMSA